MDILLFTLLGICAGGLASIVMKTRTFPGLLMDMILGVFGAIAGGIVLYLFGQQTVTEFDIASMLLATVGALAWIFVGNKLKLA